jgi:hypothetical protein
MKFSKKIKAKRPHCGSLGHKGLMQRTLPLVCQKKQKK